MVIKRIALVWLVLLGASAVFTGEVGKPGISLPKHMIVSDDGTILAYPFRVGSLECLSLRDGFTVAPLGTHFQDNPVAEQRAFLIRNGADAEGLTTPLSCLLVHVPGSDRLILVDSGMGCNASIPTTGRLARSLEAAGIEPGAVTDILLSHLHPDHIGGLFDKKGTAVFPNARYHVSREEALFWEDPAMDLSGTEMDRVRREEMVRGARKFLSVAGDKLNRFISGDDPIPGVLSISLPGHTGGQVGYLFRSGGETLLYTADALCNRFVSLQHPEWRFAFDADSPRAIVTRDALIASLTAERHFVFVPHFPLGIGGVTERGGVLVWAPGMDRENFPEEIVIGEINLSQEMEK